jgi:hypothetical protein
MLDLIKNVLKCLSSRNDIETYLGNSVDHADLEKRINYLLRNKGR